jgi:hypothetical protein
MLACSLSSAWVFKSRTDPKASGRFLPELSPGSMLIRLPKEWDSSWQASSRERTSLEPGSLGTLKIPRISGYRRPA